MSMFRAAWLGAVATLAIAVGGSVASAQSPQYGYPSKQTPVPSAQGGVPGPACYPEKVGCNVSVCPQPACQNACQMITSQIPALEVPSCQNACVIINELPPAPAGTVTIFRNHYVPIRIQNQATNVQAVNIEVRWREIHYLCDCAPGSSQCPHVPTGAPQSAPQGPAPAPQASAAVPPPPAVATPVAAAEVNTPAKRWVWLAKQGVYGFGFQNAEGFWVIDAGSKRPNAPEGVTTTTTQPAATAVTAAAPAAPAAPATPAAPTSL